MKAGLVDNYRNIRALNDALNRKLVGNYQFRSEAQWEEVAELARVIAKECDEVAAIVGARDGGAK